MWLLHFVYFLNLEHFCHNFILLSSCFLCSQSSLSQFTVLSDLPVSFFIESFEIYFIRVKIIFAYFSVEIVIQLRRLRTLHLTCLSGVHITPMRIHHFQYTSMFCCVVSILCNWSPILTWCTSSSSSKISLPSTLWNVRFIIKVVWSSFAIFIKHSLLHLPFSLACWALLTTQKFGRF